ncbi:MAG: anaerobic ribonucleoside-triphosphate reductase activating protein [Clostridiales bacterium]|nr:anaerobic ribonucleoside-triphosphate reductase activating protein [Clostridiales bacterium]
MNVAEIKTNDIANGEGVRTSLFVSGCRHCCPDCFNYMAWDFKYGKPFTDETEKEILESMAPPWIAGLSILGGEPFEPENQETLLKLVCDFKKQYPNKTIWCYSGFTIEEITGEVASRAKTDISLQLLKEIDVLVDGRFEKELKNIMLKFRGSENQRVIDVQKTLQEKQIILYLE